MAIVTEDLVRQESNYVKLRVTISRVSDESARVQFVSPFPHPHRHDTFTTPEDQRGGDRRRFNLFLMYGSPSAIDFVINVNIHLASWRILVGMNIGSTGSWSGTGKTDDC